jgi:ribosome-associated heat shock protein Hsp15
MPELESLRLDKWLWAARFFKTRKLAADAIAGGKVHLNQQRTKPGKEIKPGDHLSISKDSSHWDITITTLSSQRRPAKEAALLYEESTDSHAKRQLQIQQQREQRALLPFNSQDHKPNKKERRLIHRFKQTPH